MSKVYSYCLIFLMIYATVSTACTTAIISGTSTDDGKPMLWKDEMTKDWFVEAEYVTDGLFNVNSYISLTGEKWNGGNGGGVNDKGFIICCSTLDRADIGFMCALLRTCSSVQDMGVMAPMILDSMENHPGVPKPLIISCHITAIDAYGEGVVYGMDYRNTNLTILYKRQFDRSTPFVVAANLRLDQKPDDCYRYKDAQYLLNSVYDPNDITQRITSDFVVQTLMRGGLDIKPEGLMNPEFEHNYNKRSFISMYSTRRGWVVKGVRPGQDPRLTTVYYNSGEPAFGVAVPLFVAAGAIPPQMVADSIHRAPLNEIITAKRLSTFFDNGVAYKIYKHPDSTIIHPYPLWHDWDDDNNPLTPRRPAIQSYTLPLEQYIKKETDRFVDSLSYVISSMDSADVKTTMQTFQNAMAELAYNAYNDERFPWYPNWKENTQYEVGAKVYFHGQNWINTFEHTSTSAWFPGAIGLWFWEMCE